MPQQIDLYSDSSACPNVLSLAVGDGDPAVTVTNLGGDTVNVFTSLSAPAASTIAVSGSQTFTNPTWLTSNSRSTLQLSGGVFGP